MSFKLISRIPEIIRRSEAGVGPVNQATAERVAQSAAVRAPRGATGELAESIEARPVEGDDWEAATDLWRAHFTELGTVHSPAQPFMTPAAEESREAHVAAIRGLYR